MRLHREGTDIMLISLALLGFLSFALWNWRPLPDVLLIILTAALLVLFILVVRFFRVPKRSTQCTTDQVVAPADGKVVAIEKVIESEYFKDERLQISIFMSPLNVHVNWFPVGGRTTYHQYHPGKYLVAWHPKSSTENERSTVVVEHPQHGEVLFRQIAGAVARRIRTYCTPGTPAEQGSEFGFIKFGSRVDVFLPSNAKVKVDLEQKVTGKETVIAEF